jgi:iron complex transport system ATP-binding protein
MPFVLDNVCFAFGRRRVFDNLTLHLKKGRFYGLIGPNGCGKTTLLDILCRLRRPDAGTIRLAGRNLDAYGRKELARRISLVPQDFLINFPFTAMEIVMMGRYPHLPRFAAPGEQDLALVADIMGRTDTARFRNRLITELSGGERQRVVFARALAQDAEVMLLDEATSNLDINHSLALLNLATRQVRENNRTILASFQEINLAATFCTHLIFMQDGAIVDLGPTDEVLDAGIFRRIFGVQAKVYFEPYTASKQVVFKPTEEPHGPVDQYCTAEKLP